MQVVDDKIKPKLEETGVELQSAEYDTILPQDRRTADEMVRQLMR
jgi:hypothetical protein